MSEALTQDLRSFVTFALAHKPVLTMHRKPDARGPELTLTLTSSDQQHTAEIASLEPLMARYRPLKPFLDSILKSNESVVSCSPTTNFQPNVEHQLIRIDGEQFRIAQEMAAMLDRIHLADEAGDRGGAKSAYDTFHKFLSDKRATLVGNFKGRRFDQATAAFGANRLAADDDCSGLVIFVVIEIFIG